MNGMGCMFINRGKDRERIWVSGKGGGISLDNFNLPAMTLWGSFKVGDLKTNLQNVLYLTVA